MKDETGFQQHQNKLEYLDWSDLTCRLRVWGYRKEDQQAVQLDILKDILITGKYTRFSLVMSKYHKIGSNKFTNILEGPRIDQTHIWIYLDAQDLTQQILKFILTEKIHKYKYV